MVRYYHEYGSNLEDIIAAIEDETEDSINRVLEILQNRIDQFGVSEPTIQKQGKYRILVELAGIQDSERARALLQSTALLEFYLVKNNASTNEIISQLDNILKKSVSEEELEILISESKLDKKPTEATNQSEDNVTTVDEIFGEKCESSFIQPTFIIDYPKEMSPLTKQHRNNPLLTERFELLINGSEIANAYSELNDPIDQLERFEDQLKLSEKGDEEAMFIDHDFIRSLEYGMPPTSGIGIGIDRLVMLLTNHKSIQEVIFFPQMKPENNELKIELNDSEKSIFNKVKNEEKIDLNILKNFSGLSNKNGIKQ